MRVTVLAVAAALALTAATGCAGTPERQDGAAAPAGSPAASATATPSASAETGTTDPSAAPSATRTDAGTTTPTRCQTDQLTGSIEKYEPAGQAGSTYQARVKLTNTGNRCTMSGYISIQLLANGSPRETKVTRAGGTTETVTLDKGGSAWASIGWSFLPNPDENTDPPCNPRPTGAQVTPPGGSGSLRIAADLGVVCGHGELYLKPVSATRPS